MKPFDLEAAKRGEPIVCRAGTGMKFIAHVPDANREKRVVCLDLDDGCIETFDEYGRYHVPRGESCLDLFMAPKSEE